MGEKLFYLIPVPDWGWDQAGTCAIEVRTVAGGDAGLKRTVSLAWGREVIGQGVDPPGVQKFGKLIRHSEKAPGLFHTLN